MMINHLHPVIITMKGLSLLRGCLDELPKERKATIAGDMGELKRELREKVILVLVLDEDGQDADEDGEDNEWKHNKHLKARRESELAKSKMQPNSAHKVGDDDGDHVEDLHHGNGDHVEDHHHGNDDHIEDHHQGGDDGGHHLGDDKS